MIHAVGLFISKTILSFPDSQEGTGMLGCKAGVKGGHTRRKDETKYKHPDLDVPPIETPPLSLAVQARRPIDRTSLHGAPTVMAKVRGPIGAVSRAGMSAGFEHGVRSRSVVDGCNG